MKKKIKTNRHLIFSSVIYLFTTVGIFTWSFAVSAQQSPQWETLEKSVWRFSSPQSIGTTFAIGPNLFVTNYHVLLDLLEEESFQDFRLSNNKGEKLSFHKLIRLDLSSDLALFQTKEETEDYLDISNISEQIGDKVFTIGYPHGKFRKSESIGISNYENQSEYSFPLNHSSFVGASGSPVFNEKGKIIGVAHLASTNMVYIIKPSLLKSFIEEKAGTLCQHNNTLYINECFKKDWVKYLNVWKPHFISKPINKKNHPLAHFMLTLMYELGWGVEQDWGKAISFLDEAVKQNYMPAVFESAQLHYLGTGVEKNLDKTIALLNRAVEQEFAPALHMLAEMYCSGTGVEKNFDKAISLLNRAVEQEFAPALHMLAEMYYSGIGMEKNFNKSFSLFEKAANQNYTPALFRSTEMLYKGEGVEQDYDKANIFFNKAALYSSSSLF